MGLCPDPRRKSGVFECFFYIFLCVLGCFALTKPLKFSLFGGTFLSLTLNGETTCLAERKESAGRLRLTSVRSAVVVTVTKRNFANIR